MMKKLLYILFFLIFASGSAQSNIFEKSESENFYNDASAMDEVPQDTGVAPPPGGDDLPIDEYIPVLVIIAIGFILGTRSIKKPTI